MSGINSTPTLDQSIVRDDSVVKPVDMMTAGDLRREVRAMDPVAFENLFGEERSWNTST
jgi:hypothetical protein